MWAPIVLRMSEGPGGERQAAVEAAQKDLSDMRALVKKWEVRRHRTREGRGEERGGVLIEVGFVCVCVWCR